MTLFLSLDFVKIDSLIDEMVGLLRTWKTISQLTLVRKKEDATKMKLLDLKGSSLIDVAKAS